MLRARGSRKHRAPQNVPTYTVLTRGRARLKEKQREYQAGQALYLKDRKKLVRRILEGRKLYERDPQCEIPMEKLYEHHKDSSQPNMGYEPGCLKDFGNPVPVTAEKRSESERALKEMWQVSPQMLLEGRRRANQKSAPGPDGISLAAMAKADPKGCYASILYTLWFQAGEVPTIVKHARTILLPKSSDQLDLIKNWRPITIGNMILRLYSRILARQLEDNVSLHPQQRGFIRKASGCVENLWLLQEVIRKCKKRGKRRRLACAFLDIAQAFPSVAHGHVIEALERLGVPDKWRAIVGDLYTNATTQVQVGSNVSPPINIQRGVKQGDPLSSFLFNACMDPLLCWIDELQKGVELDHTPVVGEEPERVRLGCLTFADDMAVFGDSPSDLQEILDKCQEFYDRVGMKTNADKSRTFSLQSDKRGHSWTLTGEQYQMGGVPIPNMETLDHTRYLGLQVGPWGIDGKPEESLEEDLKRLRSAPLKGLQRVSLLSEQILPKYLYTLTNRLTPQSTLKEMDVMVRKFVREVLHLPNCFTSAFIHLTVSKGGMGIQAFEDLVPRIRCRLLKKARDGGLKDILSVLDIDSAIRSAEKTSKSTHATSQKYARRYQDKKWQGKGAEEFGKSRIANFNLNPSRTWFGHSDYSNFIQMRTNTVPTRTVIANTRKGLNSKVNCRHCPHPVETLPHVLGACAHTKSLRITRHNKVGQALVEIARKAGFDVCEEPEYTVEQRSNNTIRTERLKPDLVFIQPANGGGSPEIMVVDVTVRFEDASDFEGEKVSSLDRGAREKIEKYKRLIPVLAQAHGTEEQNVTIHPFVLGSRGAVREEEFVFLTDKLHLAKGSARDTLKRLSTQVVRDGIHIIRTFMDNSGWMDKRDSHPTPD